MTLALGIIGGRRRPVSRMAWALGIVAHSGFGLERVGDELFLRYDKQSVRLKIPFLRSIRGSWTRTSDSYCAEGGTSALPSATTLH